MQRRFALALAVLGTLGLGVGAGVGAGAGNRAEGVTTTTGTTVPGPPAIRSATAANTGITVLWNAPADDGGAPITNYLLYRATTRPAPRCCSRRWAGSTRTPTRA